MNAAMAKEAAVEEPGAAGALASLAPEQFEVRDRSSAEWLVRRLVEANAHVERVKHQAIREIRRTQRERDFLMMRYGPQLERWTREQLEQTKGRRKSVLLLAGTVGFRQTPPKLVVDDQSAVIKWAKRCCRSAVVTVERLSKTALKTHLTTTGEVPAGAHVEPPTKKFFVK
jgi:phage host-nuclease inhibitor protein Gam